MLFLEWFDSDTERFAAAGVAIVASSAWGIRFGLNYGWALFIAGWLSSLVAALWIKEKASEVQKLLS